MKFALRSAEVLAWKPLRQTDIAATWVASQSHKLQNSSPPPVNRGGTKVEQFRNNIKYSDIQ